MHIYDGVSFLFQILVHLGLLSKQSGWKFAENQFKGTVTLLITLDSNGLGVSLSSLADHPVLGYSHIKVHR